MGSSVCPRQRSPTKTCWSMFAGIFAPPKSTIWIQLLVGKLYVVNLPLEYHKLSHMIHKLSHIINIRYISGKLPTSFPILFIYYWKIAQKSRFWSPGLPNRLQLRCELCIGGAAPPGAASEEVYQITSFHMEKSMVYTIYQNDGLYMFIPYFCQMKNCGLVYHT